MADIILENTIPDAKVADIVADLKDGIPELLDATNADCKTWLENYSLGAIKELIFRLRKNRLTKSTVAGIGAEQDLL